MESATAGRVDGIGYLTGNGRLLTLMTTSAGGVDEFNYIEILFCQNGEIGRSGQRR